MTVSYSGQKKGGKRNVKFRRSGTLTDWSFKFADISDHRNVIFLYSVLL